MKRKEQVIFASWVVSFLLLGGLSFFLFFGPKEEDKTILHFEKPSIAEIYSKVKVSDFVRIEMGKLEDETIDTSRIGEHSVSFSYYNDRGKKKEGKFPLLVSDTTSPLVFLSSSYTVTKDSSDSFKDAILCGDNYDKHPNCKIEGEYVLNQVGEYPLSYVAVDSSGNTTKQDFTLRVVEKSNTSTSSPTKINFSDIKEQYKDPNLSYGIDVSKWQKDIDWKRLKESGVEFAMIRLGTQIGPHEDSKLDDYFLKNIQGAKEVGIKVGVYYYSYASSKKEAREQAKWVVKNLKGFDLDLPVVFDWECYSMFNSFSISLHDLNRIAESFLSVIQYSGYESMLYASKNYLEKIWTSFDSKIWLAHYTAHTDYQGDYLMWQLTNHGTVPGIQGEVDIDLGYFKK